MFDVGFSELILLAIVALVVLGPEKLPHAARVAGAWVGRIRRTISTMQAEIEREVGAQEIKARMEKEFGASGASNFVQELQADLQTEKTALENDFRQAENSIAGAMSETHSTLSEDATPAPVAIPAPAQTLPTAIDAAPAPLLADIATPLHEVNMDGEAAYRQWLDSQKRGNSSNPSDSTTS